MTLPRVTEIIEAAGLGPDYSMVPPATLERARLRGIALHQAIAWHHDGTLDEASLHPEVEPGFRAYLRFVAAARHEPIASEIELVHPQWQYVGHPDRIGWINGGLRAVFDYKYVATVDADATRLQIQAYKLAWNATHPEVPVMRCFAVQFFPGRPEYRLHDLTDPDVSQIFLAALVIYQERRRRGR